MTAKRKWGTPITEEVLLNLSQSSVIGLQFSNWSFRVGCMGEAVYSTITSS